MPEFTLQALAEICGAALVGDGERVITGPAALAEAREHEISFFGHARYQRELEQTRAGALVVPKELAISRKDLALLRCEDANAALAKVLAAFGRTLSRPPPGVHPSAVVDPSAVLGRDVAIGPKCVIGARAVLGDAVVVHAGAIVGARAVIGAASVLFANVVLYDAVEIGAHCVIHAGAVIGGDGFGFDPVLGPKGLERWDKVPQGGSVVIEDEVEIGANSAIDRGRFSATRIGRGSKLDNLVHVGHNVQVGEHVLLIAQVGVAGSTVIGRGAVLAGQTGVAPQLEIGAGARIAGNSAVFEDVPAGADYMGYWAQPKAEYMRSLARLKKLGELVARVDELERQIAKLAGSAT